MLLLAWTAAACTAQDAPSDPGLTSIPPETQPPPETAVPTPSGAGFWGVAFAASDAGGIPDLPLENSVVAAVPAARAPALLGVPLEPGQLRFLKHILNQPGPHLTTTVTGPAGEYILPLEPGDYVLCLGESVAQPGSFPIDLRGCGLASLIAGEQKRVDFSSGFGEVLLLEE